MGFLEVWVAYAIFGVTVFSAAFVWAVRAGQFSNLERGGHIPLDSAEPLDDDRLGRVPSVFDRYTAALLFTLLAVLIVVILGIAARGGWRIWN
jgi:nitrogen fixation-related uncharacterized protein